MNNAKWLRLFRAVIALGVDLPRVRWHYIDGDHAVWIPFPGEKDLRQRRFADGRFQPHEYKWIERLFIPHRYQVKANVGLWREQPTAAVRRAIEAAGHFALTEDDDGLSLWAYGRNEGAAQHLAAADGLRSQQNE